jgi:hypothetical protein
LELFIAPGETSIGVRARGLAQSEFMVFPRLQKDGSEMFFPARVSVTPEVPMDGLSQSVRRADRAYRGLTIAAMVVLLGSLCVFL